MTLQSKTQLPVSINAAHKSDVRTQFAALCYRVEDKGVEVLLITTRTTGRWIIPKGWPMDGLTPAASALQEAWEEAGVKGKAHERPLGLYSYDKILTEDEALPCLAMVYPVRVKSLSKKYPEVGQRRRKWMSLKKAAQKVIEPELAQIIKTFDPKSL